MPPLVLYPTKFMLELNKTPLPHGLDLSLPITIPNIVEDVISPPFIKSTNFEFVAFAQEAKFSASTLAIFSMLLELFSDGFVNMSLFNFKREYIRMATLPAKLFPLKSSIMFEASP